MSLYIAASETGLILCIRNTLFIYLFICMHASLPFLSYQTLISFVLEKKNFYLLIGIPYTSLSKSAFNMLKKKEKGGC